MINDDVVREREPDQNYPTTTTTICTDVCEVTNNDYTNPFKSRRIIQSHYTTTPKPPATDQTPPDHPPRVETIYD